MYNVLEYDNFVNLMESLNGKPYAEINEKSFRFHYQQEVIIFNFHTIISRTGRTVGYELLWVPLFNGVSRCNVKEIELGKGKFPYGEKEISSRDMSKILETIVHSIKRIRISHVR
jgi:hypothetical protein